MPLVEQDFLPFQKTSVHIRFLVRFVLLNLMFCQTFSVVLTVPVNTGQYYYFKWKIVNLFFFISKMMNIFIWSPNLNFYCCINLLNILKHHWITIEIYLRHVFRYSTKYIYNYIKIYLIQNVWLQQVSYR